MLYKTLEYISEEDRLNYGRFVHMIGKFHFGGSDVPDLMRYSVTIGDLESLYPQHDFSVTRLITMKLEEFKPKKS